MAGNKIISQLNEVTTVSNDSVLLVEDSQSTSKVTKENLLKEVNEGIQDIKENVLDGHSFKWLTSEEYEALSDEEKADLTVEYILIDKNSGLTEEETQLVASIPNKFDDVVTRVDPETKEDIVDFYSGTTLVKSVSLTGASTDKTEIVVSDTPPTLDEYPDSIIWVDTSEERVDIDEGFNSDIIDEFRSVINRLTIRVTTLEREIIALKEVISMGGGTVQPDDPTDPSDPPLDVVGIPMTLEDGSILVFEDGSIMTL